MKFSFLVLVFSGMAMLADPAAAQAPAGTPLIYQDPAAGAEARVEDLLPRLTRDEKIRLLGGGGMSTRAIERLGVPAFHMSDASCGVREQGPTTAYAASVCLAASWDAALARKVGVALGRDARSRGVNFLLGPGVNLYRAPMGGRNFEYLGEDPVLAGGTAAAFIRGVQSQGVAATLKHLAANNQEFNRHDLSSDVDERTLRELYLRTFQIALRDGQPEAVMNSYNPLNGVHTSQNHWLLHDVLKGDWGFRGLVMSDWGSCYDTLGMANAGLDLEMPDAKWYAADKIRPLLDEGRVTAPTLDDKVRRQLRVAFELGWFDRPQLDATIARDDPADAATALEEARGGMVLLKNEGALLPLDRDKLKHVVVLGPNADHPVTGGGGSAYAQPFHAVSVLDGLRQVAGDPAKVVYVDWKSGATPPADALDTVRGADAVVVSVGFDWPGVRNAGSDDGRDSKEIPPQAEGEGGDRAYALPPGSPELIRAVAALNPHTVVVLNAGGSVATADWIGDVPALVHAFYPGGAGNVALAEILFGQTNPAGKLPFSWEKRWEDSAAYGNYPSRAHPTANTYKEGVFLGYRWFDQQGIAPLFPFGFGLSYTRFEMSGLQAVRSGEGEVGFTVSVRNTGARAGAEVVQVYAAPPAGALPRPPRELKAYGKVCLQPGETKTLALAVKVADLAAWDPTTKKWTVVPGEYLFEAGDSSRELPLRASLVF